MTIRLAITLFVFGILLQGCTERADYCGSFYGAFCGPTDISHVRIGATRRYVESKLEEPIEARSVGDEQVVTYEYFVEQQVCAQVTIFGVSCWDEWEKRHLTVVYNTDQRVVSDGSDAFAYIKQNLCEMGYSQAMQLSPEEQVHRYHIYCASYPMWICIVANTSQGSDAAFRFSEVHASAHNFFEKDLSRALLWLLLAASRFETEDPTTTPQYWGTRFQQDINALKERMTPEQIAEAERLVAEWEPNPAECEIVSPGSDAP